MREKLAMKKQLMQEAEGLVGVQFNAFTIVNSTVSIDATTMLNVSLKGREYSVKTVAKGKAVQLGVQSRVMNERAILARVTTVHPFVPLMLANLKDKNYLYAVFKVQIACTLSDVLDQSGSLNETDAKFYLACVFSALQHLHDNEIIYRNVSPDTLLVGTDGYLQLMDFGVAVSSDGDPPRDYCGAAHYLSPEQVSGQGHGQGVDYWSAGILMHEMLVGSNPWLTGDDSKDSEVSIYNRISQHKMGGIENTGLTPNCERFMNELLSPVPESRMGIRGVGAEEIRSNSWMFDMDFSQLANKAMAAPHASIAASVKGSNAQLSDTYSGDEKWCAEWQ